MKREGADGNDQDDDTNPEDQMHERYLHSVRYKNGQNAGAVYAFGPSKLVNLHIQALLTQ